MTANCDPHERGEAQLDGFPVLAAGHSTGRESLEVLVSRFSEEVRRGLRPSVEKYARDHAGLAGQIRELFPLVESLEQWKSEREVDCCRRNLPDEFHFERIGNYRIIRELGRGGMGVVFEAVDERLQQAVALKLLPLRYVSDFARRKEWFHREAVLIAGLRHRNIVPVFSFGEHEGYCFYVMQLVRGVSLHWVVQRLRQSADAITSEEVRRAGRGELHAAYDEEGVFSRKGARGLERDSWGSFARIGVQTALALEHAHQHGVLHNDIKPANLLFDAGGRVVVTDFGAGRRPEAERVEGDDYPTGTLRYMAPERLAGTCDARSDVYSLAVTLYEILTLTPAFEGEDRVQLVERVTEARPRPLRHVVRSIPPGLDAVVRKGMAKAPGDRYPTARAFAADLLRFLNGERPEAARRGFLARLFRGSRNV